jgi:hypothetical protein
MTSGETVGTRVVNITRAGPGGWDIYIGRANRRYGLRTSPWANPYRIGQDGTRDEVIEKYRRYLLNNAALLARLPELRGKRLACWCAPEACHGDVLAALANALTPKGDRPTSDRP